MDDCVFCKIVSGALPKHHIYEDESVIAFLDIRPVSEGHIVIASKQHEEQVWDLDDTTYAHAMSVTRRIAKNVREKLGSYRVGMLIEGLEVPHAHIHLIPLQVGLKQTLNEKALAEPDHDALADVAASLQLN